MQANPTSKEDRRLLERLKAHPELRARFESILELAESEEGAVRTADEVEALLIEQVRRLGAETMEDWARGAQVRIEGEFKQQNPSSYRGKKNG